MLGFLAFVGILVGLIGIAAVGGSTVKSIRDEKDFILMEMEVKFIELMNKNIEKDLNIEEMKKEITELKEEINKLAKDIKQSKFDTIQEVTKMLNKETLKEEE
jgi:signal transduction histidine kinase